MTGGRVLLAAGAAILTLFGVAPARAQQDVPRREATLRPLGDFLARLEAVRSAPNPLTSDFDRARLRARPGIEAAWAGGRLAAGAGLLLSFAGDSNEDNLIRQDNFLSDEVELDRAYLRLSGRTTAYSVTAGLFDVPVQGTEILWDRDLRFLGGAGAVELPSGAFSAQRVVAGVSTGSQNREDESLAATARWEAETGPFSFGAGYWHFGETGALVRAGYARTNRLAPGGLDYLSDFDIVHVIAGWELLGKRRPLRVRLELLHNAGADDERNGGELRLDWGEIQDAGSWRLRLTFQRVEQDAALAAFGGDEWWFRTQQRGARASMAFGLGRRAFLELSALRQRRDDLDEWLDRGFIDLVVPF
ncbi:MAG TPA: putative porin [Candidatus Polarisedimenticolia bacterium]|nr:putative porin [Candidatus Polarisedimenticolia bacterium]